MIMKTYKNQTVVLDGRKKITLRASSHIATGGEGSVYDAGKVVIKIYTDTKKMQKDDMAGKIALLQSIQHPHIVSPQGIVENTKGKPIGYFMPKVKGEPLVRFFTNVFRKRVGFSQDKTNTLVEQMREAIIYAHQQKAVLVDANEMNYIVDMQKGKDPKPYLIDVDSWSIGRWCGSVIMPSIRDWQNSDFTTMTDWFAWGIVTFQAYTGVHPYKGTLPGFKRGDLEKRMKRNASVFSPEIRLNRAVRDFGDIPGPLLDWYKATFHDGERMPPPSVFLSGVARTNIGRVLHMTITASGSLIHEVLLDKVHGSLTRVFPCGVALTEGGLLVDIVTKRVISSSKTSEVEVVRTPTGWLIADTLHTKPTFFFVNRTSLQEERVAFDLEYSKVVRFENRLFVVTNNGLMEVLFRYINKPLLAPGSTCATVASSTRWFDGVGVQDMLGVTYLITPFSDKSCIQVRTKELDDYTIVSAYAGERMVVLVGIDAQGVYKRFDFAFDANYATYNIYIQDVDDASCNTTLLPRGVRASVYTDGELEIFVPSSGNAKVVQDKMITTNMSLAHIDNTVVYIHDGIVSSLRMK